MDKTWTGDWAYPVVTDGGKGTSVEEGSPGVVVTAAVQETNVQATECESSSAWTRGKLQAMLNKIEVVCYLLFA
jgi:hypothetical protein